jgi:hypothetical protein
MPCISCWCSKSVGVLKGFERCRRPYPVDARLADTFVILVVSIIDEAKVTSDIIIGTATYDSDRALALVLFQALLLVA